MDRQTSLLNDGELATLIGDIERRLGVAGLRRLIRLPFSWPPEASTGGQLVPGDARSDAECLRDWLLAVAGRGHGRALVFAVRMLREGIGLPVDLPAARTLLERAQVYRFPDAAFALAQMLERGEGGSADPVAALELYRCSGELASGRLALAKLREALPRKGVEAVFDLEDARDGFLVAADRGELASGGACARIGNALRLLHPRGLLAEMTMAVLALEAYAVDRIEEAQRHEADLMVSVERLALSGEGKAWRLLGRLQEIGLNAASEPMTDETYRRGMAAGDGACGVLLGLRELARLRFDSARECFAGLKVAFADGSECWGFDDFSGCIAWRPAGLLVFRLNELLSELNPELYRFSLPGDALQKALVAAFEGVKYPDGHTELAGSQLIHLLQSGPAPCELTCSICERTWQGREAIPKTNLPMRGPGSVICPEGHRMVTGDRVIFD